MSGQFGIQGGTGSKVSDIPWANLMNHWLQKSIANLLPLSVAQDFNQALGEWFFTGEVIDYFEEDILCELCEHPDLAHHYEIKNKLTEKLLLVGSSCILRFQEIEIYDLYGVPITKEDSRKAALELALTKARKDAALEDLRGLWVKDLANRKRIQQLGQAFKRGDSFSPDDAAFLYKRMVELGISYLPTRYKINLRGYYEQAQLAKLPDEEFKLLYPSLSASQRKAARRKPS